MKRITLDLASRLGLLLQAHRSSPSGGAGRARQDHRRRSLHRRARERRRLVGQVRGIPRDAQGRLDPVMNLFSTAERLRFRPVRARRSGRAISATRAGSTRRLSAWRLTTTRFRTTWGTRDAPVAESAPGVWNMSETVRKSLETPSSISCRPRPAPIRSTRPCWRRHSRQPTASTSRACASAARLRSTSAGSCPSTCRSPTCASSRPASAGAVAGTSEAW